MRRLRRHHRLTSIAAAAALPLVPLAASSSSSSSSVCPVDGRLSAGSSSCSSACNGTSAAACIAFDPNSNVCAVGNGSASTVGCPLVASDACAFQCIPWTNATSRDTFAFYIAPSLSGDDNAQTLWQNHRFVSSIGAIDVPDRIRVVSIMGGSSARGMAAGDVVDARVGLALSGAYVTNLTLANLNMAVYTTPSVRVVQSPPRLQSLRLRNCKLSTLPIESTALTALTALDLSQNEIGAFSRNLSMESLVQLNLSNSSLSTFDATFRALQTLDLSHNQLAAIPPNVFQFPSLKTLDISGNPLDSTTFTWAEYWFLSNLTTLHFSGFSKDVPCKPENKQFLKAYIVCVLDSPDLVVVSKASLTMYIAIPVIGTLVVSTAAFSLWYYRRKKHHAKRNGADRVSTQTKTDHLTHGDDHDGFIRLGDVHTSDNDKHAINKASTGSLWVDEDLLACQLRYEDVEDIEQIGIGAFAVVWLVKYRQSRLLASKRLLKDQKNRKRTLMFVAEIKLNAQLEHPSIVQFVGAAWTVETDLQALFEYMENGDLRGYLDATRNDSVHNAWTPLKLAMAIEITEALVYVHSFSPPLVHRDLKSRNILLDKDMQAKLSDFGVSRFASENGTMTAGVGTSRWLAPEVLAGGHDYDQRCDIYSFGVVLSELDTHALPYEDLGQSDVATLQLVMAGSARPRLSDRCPHVLRDLATRCLAFDPNDRPSAMEAAFILRTFAEETTEASPSP